MQNDLPKQTHPSCALAEGRCPLPVEDKCEIFPRAICTHLSRTKLFSFTARGKDIPTQSDEPTSYVGYVLVSVPVPIYSYVAKNTKFSCHSSELFFLRVIQEAVGLKTIFKRLHVPTLNIIILAIV